MEQLIVLERFEREIDANLAMSTLKNAHIECFFEQKGKGLFPVNGGGLVIVYKKDAERAFHLLHPNGALSSRTLPFYESTHQDITIKANQRNHIILVAVLIILILIFLKYFQL